jgi:hypothetical protein
MDDHVHALLQGRQRDGRVGVIGRHHLDGGHVLLFIQQLAEVGVSRAALVRRPAALLGVIGLDDLLADVAAAGHVIGALAPGGVADQPPDHVADLVLAPLEVMRAVLLDVAHGDDLHVGAGEDAADLADRLGAETDAGQGDFFAGRDESRAAQHMPRHDGERGGGRPAGPNPLAPREALWVRIAARVAYALGRGIFGCHKHLRLSFRRGRAKGSPSDGFSAAGAGPSIWRLRCPGGARSRRQKAQGRRHKAQGRRQKAEGTKHKAKSGSRLLLPPAFCSLPSAFCSLPSALCLLLSAFCLGRPNSPRRDTAAVRRAAPGLPF